MKKSIFTLLRRRRQGFTLAEVMIAMGIVATVMTALLGMIPLGVRSVQEAANMTISGRIAQEVISNIQQSKWGELEDSFDNETFLFDHEGFLIRGGSRDKSPTYEARVQVTSDPVIKFGTTEYTRDSLRKVLVEVEYTPDGQKIPVKERAVKETNPNIRKYNFYVANQNKTG